MFMRSERLFLRPTWPEDRAEVETALGAQTYRLAALPATPRHPRFLITLPDHSGARAVGVIALWPCADACQIGIWVAPHCRGRGFATEAMRAVLPLARTLGHCRLIATPPTDCPASRAVLARSGFVSTGQLRLRDGVASETYALHLCPQVSGPADRDALMRAA